MSTYFRCIVLKNDQFVFRTSRLHSPGAALNVRADLDFGFNHPEKGEIAEHKVQVLRVIDGEGALLTSDELAALSIEELNRIETASENAQPL